jgi:acetylglutamate/LysW-gamma-L-alpha-aminoadipate kinase
MERFPDESSLVAHIPRAQLDDFLPFAQGRMKKKLLGAAEAVGQGVGRVVLADARVSGCVSRALEGVGTVIS